MFDVVALVLFLVIGFSFFWLLPVIMLLSLCLLSLLLLLLCNLLFSFSEVGLEIGNEVMAPAF